jgi:hypothetical protein
MQMIITINYTIIYNSTYPVSDLVNKVCLSIQNLMMTMENVVQYLNAGLCLTRLAKPIASTIYDTA